MKTSLWLNTDPLSGYNPIQETEHYIDGQHNGGIFNPMNLNTYTYTYQNPVIYVDPNGKQNISGYLIGKILTEPQNGYSNFTKSAVHILNKVSGFGKSLQKSSGIAQAAETNNIYSTQKTIVKSIVNKYYEAMKNGSYKSEGGAGFIYKGKYILTEGNHRMNAALKYANETGNSKYVEDIINKGNFQKANPSNYGYKINKLPTSEK